MENKSSKKPSSYKIKKGYVQKPQKSRNNIYITSRTNFKAQLKQCQELLDSGAKEIYLHCLGNAIVRGMNLALNLVAHYNNAVSYAINTSTVHIIDELHPLFDADDVSFQRRNNSAIHIRITKNIITDTSLA